MTYQGHCHSSHDPQSNWQQQSDGQLQWVVPWQQIKLWGARVELGVEVLIGSEFGK